MNGDSLQTATPATEVLDDVIRGQPGRGEREIFIRIKQATKRDMPIKPGAYCLATYQ